MRDYSDSPPFFTVGPYEPGPATRQLVEVEQAQDQTSVTLASDILFTIDGSDLTEPARATIGALVAQVPAGATVTVDGHTDSAADTGHNQDLSDVRAQAVADAVGGGRPDLVLDVQGHGESDLKVHEEGADSADDRAGARPRGTRAVRGDPSRAARRNRGAGRHRRLPLADVRGRAGDPPLT